MARNRIRVLLTSICLAAFAAQPARAVYPERVISMIVAYVPGGGTDVLARLLAPYLEKHMGGGARIIVVNKPGAGGEIGFAAIANAPPNGYTIGLLNSPIILSIPIERQAQYSPLQFELLGNLVDDPGSITVHADNASKDLNQLAAYARVHPGALTVGTPGTGAPGHLAMLMFAKLVGTSVTHVPFKGVGDVHVALAGKHISLAAVSVGEALQALHGGKAVRVLAQLSPDRTTLAPDLPTAKEQGFNLEMSSLRGLGGPKGMPPDVLDKLVKALELAVADPEFQVKAAQSYAPLRYLAPAQFETALAVQDGALRRIWKETPWSEK